jgi:flagellar motor switch protein FliG
MDRKTIVLTLYGTKEAISDFSITLFDEDRKAFDFCSNINELNLKDDEWVYAAIIRENQKNKLVKTGYTDFDVLCSLDDRTIQKVLREIDKYELAEALKSAKKDVFSAVLRNMSKRSAIMLIEDMEYMGPVMAKHVQKAQNHIVEIIRHLEIFGEITIPKASNDKVI